ncbi:MAG: deoxyribonuclease IV [Lachnospiraceae bacterium]|jgi:deoxyribonuclease-4|nr:deoxyribonuclease IV [Lachnospiraceae bacterium]
MLRIGCHLSSAKGYLAMGKEAVAIGANTFQFFTRNPRGGRAKELDLADIEAYLEFAKVQGIGQILAHAPYTLNACSKDQGLRQFAYETMCDDLNRLQYLPEAMYNFHPGSHVKQGVEQGISYIVELLNRINEQDRKTIMLLETMAGKGSEVGQSFEELQTILEKVEDSRLLGVCLDTCHVFDAGYDIVHSLEDVLEEFDKIIGMERLMAVHLNDSKNARGSHKDRHEKIGEGQIGLEAFVRIVTHPKLNKLPFYLETPNDLEGYQQEIAWLREKAEYEET